MDCKGLVIEDRGETALVRVARVNCAECGGCGFFSRNRDHTLEFEAVNRAGAREGEEVLMRVPRGGLALLYLYAFGLPLLAMAVVFGLAMLFLWLAGSSSPQGPAVAAALVAGLASFWVGSRMSARRELKPEILEVLGEVGRGGDVDSYRGEVL